MWNETFVLNEMAERPKCTIVGDMCVVHNMGTKAPFYFVNTFNVTVV
jgi:hypothetical protein